MGTLIFFDLVGAARRDLSHHEALGRGKPLLQEHA